MTDTAGIVQLLYRAGRQNLTSLLGVRKYLTGSYCALEDRYSLKNLARYPDRVCDVHADVHLTRLPAFA